MSYPHENAGASSSQAPGNAINGTTTDPADPTSSKAKEQFAESNDPIQHQSSSGLTPPEGQPKERKRSWIEKLKEPKRAEISDEDMKKVSS